MIEPKYQTFWPRLWAGLVDGVVFLPVSLVDLIAYREFVPIWLRAAWYVASLFGFITYVVLMHARYGQTLGKMATRVKVLDISESKLAGRQALMREIVPIGLTVVLMAYGLPSVLAGVDPTRVVQPEMPGVEYWLAAVASFGWFAAELVTMLTNSKRRAVHDFIAGSVVVRLAKPALAVSRESSNDKE